MILIRLEFFTNMEITAQQFIFFKNQLYIHNYIICLLSIVFFFFCQDQGDRLKGELYSQPLVRFYLDYICDYLPCIHTDLNFLQHAHKNNNIYNIYNKNIVNT
jgi:hypothetical protein